MDAESAPATAGLGAGTALGAGMPPLSPLFAPTETSTTGPSPMLSLANWSTPILAFFLSSEDPFPPRLALFFPSEGALEDSLLVMHWCVPAGRRAGREGRDR